MAWPFGVPRRREQPVAGGRAPVPSEDADTKCPHSRLRLRMLCLRRSNKVRLGSPGWFLCPPPSPLPSRDSLVSSRGWRTRLLMRARVAEKTSSSRSRASSSGLHMAGALPSEPVDGAQARVRAPARAGSVPCLPSVCPGPPATDVSYQPGWPQRGISGLAANPCPALPRGPS